MGYYTRITGSIGIDPPLTAREYRECPHAVNSDYCVRVWPQTERIQTEDGELTKLQGVAITPFTDAPVKAYDLLDEVAAIVASFPGRTFTGHLQCQGDEATDLWRVVVRDGIATEIKPRITWPEDEQETANATP